MRDGSFGEMKAEKNPITFPIPMCSHNETVEDLEAALKQFAKIGVDVAPNENELIKPD
jgi:hypothetical protein